MLQRPVSKKRNRRAFLALTLVLALFAALACGCGAKSMMNESAACDSNAAEAPMQMAAEYEAVTEDAVAEYNAQEGGSASVSGQTQKLIQNIYVNMTASDPSEAMAQIVRYAQQTGGYLLSSSDYYNSEENTGGANVRVRVPSGTSEQFKTYLSELGRIDSSSSESQDVTSAYYDLETRIAQGKDEIEKLTELLSKCETIEEVLQVRAQLSSVQADVESMQGEFKRLSELTSFDTIEVSISPVRSMVQGSDGARFMTGSELWDGIVRGLESGVRAIVNGAGYLLIFLAGAILPLGVLALIVWLIVVICRRASRRRKKRRMEKFAAAQNTAQKKDGEAK